MSESDHHSTKPQCPSSDSPPREHENTIEELDDEQLRRTAILDAQVRLIQHLCRLVAESWRKHQLEKSD